MKLKLLYMTEEHKNDKRYIDVITCSAENLNFSRYSSQGKLLQHIVPITAEVTEFINDVMKSVQHPYIQQWVPSYYTSSIVRSALFDKYAKSTMSQSYEEHLKSSC
jgi:hypothetical protein